MQVTVFSLHYTCNCNGLYSAAASAPTAEDLSIALSRARGRSSLEHPHRLACTEPAKNEACAWAAVDSASALRCVRSLSLPRLLAPVSPFASPLSPDPLYASMDAFPASVPPAYGQP